MSRYIEEVILEALSLRKESTWDLNESESGRQARAMTAATSPNSACTKSMPPGALAT